MHGDRRWVPSRQERLTRRTFGSFGDKGAPTREEGSVFWLGVVTVLVVVLAAAFAFDRRHRNSRGGGDVLGAYNGVDVEVGPHRGISDSGGASG